MIDLLLMHFQGPLYNGSHHLKACWISRCHSMEQLWFWVWLFLPYPSLQCFTPFVVILSISSFLFHLLFTFLFHVHDYLFDGLYLLHHDHTYPIFLSFLHLSSYLFVHMNDLVFFHVLDDHWRRVNSFIFHVTNWYHWRPDYCVDMCLNMNSL